MGFTRRMKKGLAQLGMLLLRATKSFLPQAPLKLTLGGLLGEGPELEEDVPEPEELDWWSKYHASLQELQGQVGGGHRWELGVGCKWQAERFHWVLELYSLSKLFITVILYHNLFIYLWDWSLNSGLHTCKAGALPLEPHIQFIVLWLFWRWDLTNYLYGLASNLDPPNLSLSSCSDYRLEPLTPCFYHSLRSWG
jgi:hypothetical protein